MAGSKATEADDDKGTSGKSTKGSDKGPEKGSGKASDKGSGSGSSGLAVAAARTRAAQVVWLFFVICALLLAVGALLVALDANNKNALVQLVLDGADAVDLGIFSRRNGIKEFTGGGADVKNALLNWGLGAVAYLVVGRILDRLIRP